MLNALEQAGIEPISLNSYLPDFAVALYENLGV
jgi:hypothetical protein